MWLEAAAWGVGLLLVAQAALLLHGNGLPRSAAAAMTGAQPANDLAARFVGYLGAGIYEELLFRLMLLPATIALLRTARLSRQASLPTAVVLTSLMFAAAHYRMDAPLGLPVGWTCGEPFTPLGFVFRFAGGASLATLFAYRGFGIAVGAHAVYDLLVLQF
jgi:membrane protease YdiL (CAAX protease family)